MYNNLIKKITLIFFSYSDNLEYLIITKNTNAEFDVMNLKEKENMTINEFHIKLIERKKK